MPSAINSAITTFDSIFDLNVGLIRVIQKHYGKDTEHFNRDLLSLPDDDIAYSILTLRSDNPVDFVINDKYKDSSADLKDQIMEKYYSEIIKLSRPTALFDLFMAFKTLGGGNMVNASVVCKDEQQLQFIKKNIPTIEAVVKEYKDINRESYGSIYINKFTTLSEFDRVLGKTIFLLNYRYNFEEDGSSLNKDYYRIYSEFNEIRVMDTFINLQLCEG